MLGRALALDRAGSLDAAGIEQQLLGKRGLTGVRVADDRELRRDEISSDRLAMRILSCIECITSL